MDPSTLRRYLDDPIQAEALLRSWGLQAPRRAHANLVEMANSGVTLDLLGHLCDHLAECIRECPDPDMAMNNLARFVSAARNPLAVGTLFQRDPKALTTLVQMFSTSQHLSDLLVADPESFDLLRLTEGQPVARQALVDELTSEVDALDHESVVLRALRRFKRREILRIAYGDIVREQSLDTVTAQISYLADAILEAAVRAAWKRAQRQRGVPRTPAGQPARFVILGMGKLGGVELNYSSDIDLIFLYEADGHTETARRMTNAEYFERLARDVLHLLTEPTELGVPYRVDMRLRPEGQHGALAISVPRALQYYDVRGRTWERQAFIKARPVAGDLALGHAFLEQLQPWVYQRYLSAADISDIKALKRRIEERALREGGDLRDVKSGRGGIRDIEFVIQFLQLLNGGDLPALRTGNTLEALARLEQVGCLSHRESALLSENYATLRKIEHRLQILFDLRTHTLPDDAEELRKLALRCGYADTANRCALEAFEADYRTKTAQNRLILNHLLHEAFPDDPGVQAEVDLVLDPDPPESKVAEVLGKYGFREVKQAHRNLLALGEERIRFLSTRRSRHFLASIAPRLLAAVAATPDPDATLVHLGQVSDSLGGKGVLWELFSFNPHCLRLYVELCAYSPYLSGILVSNPGMIDSLMDSLVLDKLPTRPWLQRTLEELCYGAEDLDPILHSFKNDQQLCVGVRDLLGKEDVQATTETLSHIADTCLTAIAASQYEKLAVKFGQPTVGQGPDAGQPAEMVILALGKFGGREMNYHSDLDIIFLYESDGHTVQAIQSGYAPRSQTTTNQHFFSELAQRIIRATSRLTAYGRLYEVDARLRPTGKSGSLAVSLEELGRYFSQKMGQLWERQALCKARVAVGSPRMAQRAMAVVRAAAFGHPWQPECAREIRTMRHRLEETASGIDLKRGPGGIVDIEFLVQMLQLKHGQRQPEICEANTLDALRALHEAGHLPADDFRFFTESYRYLRTLEGRLRLTSATARDRLPDDPRDLAKLAHLMRVPSADQLLAQFEHYTHETRCRFDRWLEAEGA